MQMVTKLLDSETVRIWITDSFIAQLYAHTTRSDVATQVPTTKMRSMSVSVFMKVRDKGKRLLHNCKHSHHNVHYKDRNTNRHQPQKNKRMLQHNAVFEHPSIGNVSTNKCIT